jgi:hypothetical protein
MDIRMILRSTTGIPGGLHRDGDTMRVFIGDTLTGIIPIILTAVTDILTGIMMIITTAGTTDMSIPKIMVVVTSDDVLSIPQYGLWPETAEPEAAVEARREMMTYVPDMLRADRHRLILL